MSKKRGLSVEEKRTRALQFLYETKDFFQMKELERILPKEKGITSQSVKEIVQSLVDDVMVDSEKIGTSVYFWAFPSKASQKRKRKMTELGGKIEECKKRKLKTEENIKGSRVGKEASSKRDTVLSELASKKAELQEVCVELERYRECDPEVMQRMAEEVITAKEAANRWTDNIFAIKSWAKNKFCMEGSVMDKQFGIPEDFDYVD